MKIKSMYKFEGLHMFFLFSDEIEKINWKIEKQLLKERVERYKLIAFFSELKQQFNANNVSIWELKEEEIITWIDTITLLRRMFLKLLKKGHQGDDVYVLMEYPLVNGNYMRTDYLIVYQRLIFVLEFGMFNQDEKRSEERYTKKLQESINYRQIIANQVANDVQVINYVMIYRPEFDRYENKIIKENVNYNDEELRKLSCYIFHLFNKQQNLSAINQLKNIEITNN
jgi:hypothetical protein